MPYQQACSVAPAPASPVQPLPKRLPVSLRVRLRLVRGRGPLHPLPIVGPADIWTLLRAEVETSDRERFLIVHLDGKGRITGVDEGSVGSLTGALVHPREVFKAAILGNAASIICVHNHPSGDPTPSAEDLALTKRLREAGDLLGIRILDHVIIGARCFHSMSEKGDL